MACVKCTRTSNELHPTATQRVGAYGGAAEEGGRCSYVMEASTPFRLTDFGQSSPARRALWAILKQESHVVSYYEPPVPDVDAPTFEFAQAKRRLQQAKFGSPYFPTTPPVAR